MDKRVIKPILRNGRAHAMSVAAVAKAAASGIAHSSQHAARPADHFVRPVDVAGSADKAEAEAKRRFDAWRAKYEPVAREIYEGRRKRAESKRRRAKARRKAFGDLCEMTEGLAAFCRRNGVSLAEGERMVNQFRRREPYAMFFVTLFFDIAWFGAVFLRKELTRRIERVRHESMRPYYYEQEKARRQAMAEERRRIRRRSTRNACPTREEIVDAWKKVKDSNEDLLRFGSLIEDLECYVDNSLIRDDSGAIIGRRSGIKGWLQVEIPALYAVYSRVMAYKAAAKRMRQIIEISDPLSLSSVLDMGTERKLSKDKMQDYGADEILDGARQGEVNGGKRRETRGAMTEKAGDMELGVLTDRAMGEMSGDVGGAAHDVARGRAMDEAEEVALLRARAIYLEVIRPVGEGARRQTALIERMAKLTDPESIEDCNMLAAWRRKYERKITVRTKSMWVGRLVRRMLA